MIRVDNPEVKKPQWDKEITVKMTLGELAYIRAVVGNTMSFEDEIIVDRLYGSGTYNKINRTVGTDSVGKDTFSTTSVILREEGVDVP